VGSFLDVVDETIHRGVVEAETGRRVGPFDPAATNFILTHSSDGEAYVNEQAIVRQKMQKLYPLFSQVNYLEVSNRSEWLDGSDLMKIYKGLAPAHPAIRIARAATKPQALAALRTFYGRGSSRGDLRAALGGSTALARHEP
jgi:hypothetical protein